MRRILVVDDQEDVRHVTSEILSREGFSVATAENGAVGYAAFTESAFDLVITDLYMPEKEGIELIRDIRRTHDIPIIAISGGPSGHSQSQLAMAAALGANATLAKPFSRQQLIDTVKAVIDAT